ncbi:hypothetical protein GCM10009125_08240 [Castellaniella daejeonensis]|uniref:DUF7424 domain-containing protein n=2 Tax=Castellaniella daejeonensis TaxID=659013 RepID=A0ABN0TH27_9BURK
MRRMRIAALAAAVLALAGCKTTVNSEIAVSELQGGQSKELPGDLYVEVASCNDFEDSRKPSKTLLDVQQKIPGVFPTAVYKECFRQKMDSYAHFSMPLFLDLDKDGKLGSEQTINVISNDTAMLGLAVPDALQKQIASAKKDALGSLDLSVLVKVTNDTKEEFRFVVGAAYIDDHPVTDRVLVAPAGASFVVRLSDVAVDAAVAGQNPAVLKVAPPKS